MKYKHPHAMVYKKWFHGMGTMHVIRIKKTGELANARKFDRHTAKCCIARVKEILEEK